MGEDDHECAWKDAALRLSSQLKEQAEATDQLKAELEALKRHVHGRRSEKMPPMDREVKRDKPTDPEQKRKTRQANAELRAKALKTETQEVPVPEEAKSCPQCGGGAFKDHQSPKSSAINDYVPG
jgi:transposase